MASSPSVFLPRGYEVVDGRIVYQGGAFTTRLEGYGKSRKVWLCRACFVWHDAPKPTRCVNCRRPDFLYFDSAGEARWFAGLVRALERDEIAELIHHPVYEIWIAGPQGEHTKVFNYIADAEYVQNGKVVSADFKPKARRGLDPVFKIKRRCFEAQYARRILIVTEE
jgi:hypothetical protein